MAASGSGVVSNQGVYRFTGSVQTNETPLTVYVGHLRDATVQIVRTAGSTGNTLAVTGSNDGTNFFAVTSTQQGAVASGDGGGDTALSAVAATGAVHTIRQKVEYLRFTPSDDNDTFSVVVSGLVRD